MKRIAFAAALCLVASSAASAQTVASAQSLKATCAPKQASVFYQGATLTYTAKVGVKAGSQTVVLDGICPSFDMNSLKVKADRGVLISSVSSSAGTLADRESEKAAKAAKDSLETAKASAKGLEAGIAAGRKMLELLQEGVGSAMKDGRSSLVANLDAYRKNAQSINADLSKDEAALAKTKDLISALEKRVAKLEGAAKKPCSVLTLAVSAPAAATATFSVSLFTYDAAWTPHYEISSPGLGEKITLQAKATVRQNTGLDWKGVALTLSSGRPGKTNIAPEFSTWYLRQKVESPVVYRAATKAMGANLVMADMAVAEEALESGSMDSFVAAEETDLSLSFSIALPYDIPGNGKTAEIDLKSCALDADYRYICRPKLSDEVFLTAALSGWEKEALLPGRASVNFAGEFVGSTRFDPTKAGSALELTLGTTDRISVKREVLKNLKATSTLGSNTTEYKGWKILVRNGLNRAAKIVVEEQYPVSADKAIEVKLGTISPAATSNDAAKGVVRWEFTLEAGASAETSLDYSIKYPKDWKI